MKPVSSGRRGTDLTGAQVVLRRIAGTTYNLGWGYLPTLREWIRGFHDRLPVHTVRMQFDLNENYTNP
jgi:hypothetical protein